MRQGVTLVTGPSGSGKTELVTTVADHYLWRPEEEKEENQSVLRVYSTDGGAWGNRMTRLVNLGIIEVARLRGRWQGQSNQDMAEETMMLASQGYWPEEISDPTTGEVPPGVKMLPPAHNEYRLICPKDGALVLQGLVRAQLEGVCPTCKEKITSEAGRTQVAQIPNPGFERVGGVAFEGITSMAKVVMESLFDRNGRAGSLSGALAGSSTGTLKSGAMIFGGSNKAHYGMAHTMIEKWLLAMGTIPNMRVDPVVTGLEVRSGDDTDNPTGVPVYGPLVVGKAMNLTIPQLVGNYLGSQVIVDEKKNRRFRLCLTKYVEGDGTPHIYKNRCEAGTMPEYLEDESDSKEHAHKNHSLGRFFQMVDEQLEKNKIEDKGRFKQVPGLPKGKLPISIQAQAQAPKSSPLKQSVPPMVVGVLPKQ